MEYKLYQTMKKKKELLNLIQVSYQLWRSDYTSILTSSQMSTLHAPAP